MTESKTNVDGISQEALTPIVRRVLGRPAAAISDWQHAPLGYRALALTSGGLHRFFGSAQDGGERLSWSVVLKVIRSPEGGGTLAPSHHWYWKREVAAYQSGLLEDLPAGLTAPRCFEITETAADVAWLWLEEITDTVGAHWPLSCYRMTGRHLGCFNGAYLAGRPLPSFPWLGRGWLRSWVADWARSFAVLEQPGLWEHPLVRPFFPRSAAARLQRLCAERERILDALDELPQTLCHGDAGRQNLFARQGVNGEEETVAIDWAFVGPGAVGTEVGQLVAVSLMLVPEAASLGVAELASQVLEGYLEGLGEAGWHGDRRATQFGMAALIALRWGLMLPGILSGALDESQHAQREQRFGETMPAGMRRWGEASDFLLDQADEAWRLMQ